MRKECLNGDNKMKKRKKSILIGGIIIIILASVFALTIFPKKTNFDFDGKMTIYKSALCGCCGLYSDYVEKKSNLKIDIVEFDDVSPIKDKYNVPDNLRSCHISVIGDYFVEGHVPLEAIAKLMTEKPDIAGIALPGMPTGSPGMPGKKLGDFVIYAIHHDGSYEEFMRL